MFPAASTAIAVGESSPVAIPPIETEGSRLPNMPAGNSPIVSLLALVTKRFGDPEAAAQRAPMTPAAISNPASATNVHADVRHPALRLLTVISPR